MNLVRGRIPLFPLLHGIESPWRFGTRIVYNNRFNICIAQSRDQQWSVQQPMMQIPSAQSMMSKAQTNYVTSQLSYEMTGALLESKMMRFVPE